MRISALNSVWSDTVELRIAVTNGGGTHVAQPLVYDKHTTGEIVEPFLRLGREDAQTLIDALYSTGLRPSQSAGSAGQLSSTQYHLEDMRKLVFNGK